MRTRICNHFIAFLTEKRTIFNDYKRQYDDSKQKKDFKKVEDNSYLNALNNESHKVRQDSQQIHNIQRSFEELPLLRGAGESHAIL